MFGGGIVAVFAVLGLLIAVLHVIDWGHLFTQTWFITTITVVLLAMAAGTFGLFDFALPTGVYTFSPPARQRLGQLPVRHVDRRPEHAVHVRPADGPAHVLTLKLPAAAGLGVFVTIGLGMAAPYVLLTRVPRAGPPVSPGPGRGRT